MSDDTVSNRRRKAVGPERPSYLDNGDIDRVMSIVLALVSEVASIRERLDAHERIGTSGTVPTFDLVEAHVPDAATEGAREAWRDGYIRRLFRVISEDVDAMRAGTSPQDDPETDV